MRDQANMATIQSKIFNLNNDEEKEAYQNEILESSLKKRIQKKYPDYLEKIAEAQKKK